MANRFKASAIDDIAEDVTYAINNGRHWHDIAAHYEVKPDLLANRLSNYGHKELAIALKATDTIYRDNTNWETKNAH